MPRNFLAFALSLSLASPALAAPCSDTGGKYEDWKPVMAKEARAEGVGEKGIAALMGTSYSKATLSADRGQKRFKYSLEKFLKVRGADTIISQGRSKKKKNADTARTTRFPPGSPAARRAAGRHAVDHRTGGSFLQPHRGIGTQGSKQHR